MRWLFLSRVHLTAFLKTNPIKCKESKLLLQFLSIRNKHDHVHESVKMTFFWHKEIKQPVQTIPWRLLHEIPVVLAMWNFIYISLLCSNNAYWLFLYCSSFVSQKQTCPILQFSSAPFDLCRPQLQRLRRIKWNEMAQRWCGCGSLMASCFTKMTGFPQACPEVGLRS